MTFLEAHKIVSTFAGGPPLRFLLAMSGMPDQLDLFVRASGAVRGRSTEARTLPFNTLSQTLIASAAEGEREVFVLLPWDLVPEADWRSGLATDAVDMTTVQTRALDTAARLQSRRNARFLYVPAPLPPLFPDSAMTARLGAWLSATIVGIGGELLEADTFSFGGYLTSGSAFASRTLDRVADAIVTAAMSRPPEPKKVLVTDLDNVMWKGIIGEDGLDGIHFSSEGPGFKHFIYQTFLIKLKREGALLVAVSRNDEELATAPFLSGRMTLKPDDFVTIAASYNAKSSQIREIANQLNLGLDSFVFVDDNPVEIEEVSRALPEIRTVQFPLSDNDVPAFFDAVAALFARTIVTTEDAERTAMYRRRLEGMVPTDAEGADLSEFLRGLGMTLTIHDRSTGDRARAVQLINKTNQFNLNGRRVTDDDVASVLDSGGRLYTCSLSDRTGSHGEILSCLIDAGGTVRSLVMSCRVFQRRVEHAFFAWLGQRSDRPSALEFASTPRNEPIVQFLDDPSFMRDDQSLARIAWDEFDRKYRSELELFALVAPEAVV